MYRNPIIAGTSPDPSVCRVGNDYYLVTSSFEYFPGVPIYHSKDLVHWRKLGHVLTRPSQLNLLDTPSSQGIFAPTIRYHGGLFYMVTTNMQGGGSFYVTATDPAGPWSDPVWVRESVFTMDPSLFFDDDGKVYYTRHGEQRHGGIFQAEIDIATGKLAREPVQIWKGTGDIWPEGPHLYKIHGKYYLMISEGGTSYEHMVTIARADNPWGPFEAYAKNPILTHRFSPELPIQATGHADLIDTPDGHWWMTLLGIRPSTPGRHHIGRETFLAPVTWSDEAWPIVNQGNPLSTEMPWRDLPVAAPWPVPPIRETFTTTSLGPEWQYLRAKVEANYSLTAREGYLRLTGSEANLQTIGLPTLIVQPQRHHRVRIAAEVELDAQPGQRGGLVVRGNEANHFELLIEGTSDGRQAVARLVIDGRVREVGRHALTSGTATLRIEGFADRYEFFVEQASAAPVPLGSGPTTPFAYEETQSFTGAYVGLYANQDTKAPPSQVYVNWLEYQPEP